MTIKPQSTGPTRAQIHYGYLGARQRNTTLPSGAIEMGARLYVPQLGRFLQPDPIYGGSANAYDYSNQDPINQTDLEGTSPDGPAYWGVIDKCAVGFGDACSNPNSLGAVLLDIAPFLPIPGLTGLAEARIGLKAGERGIELVFGRTHVTAGLKTYKDGGRMVAELRWKRPAGKADQFIRLDKGGAHGVHLDVRAGKFRRKHWKPWER